MQGWNKPGTPWSFATLGAVPSPASVTGAAPGVSSCLVTLMVCLVMCLVSLARH